MGQGSYIEEAGRGWWWWWCVHSRLTQGVELELGSVCIPGKKQCQHVSRGKVHTSLWTCCVSARGETSLAPCSRRRKQAVPRGGHFTTLGTEPWLYTKESPKAGRELPSPRQEEKERLQHPGVARNCLLMSYAEQRDFRDWGGGSARASVQA